MKEYYELTSTEEELMNYLWLEDKKVSFKQVMEYCNTVLNKGWKKQTLSTYLKKLQTSDFVGVDSKRKNYLYYAKCSKEEYAKMCTQKIVGDFFDNSISKLVAAFVGNDKLSDDEAESLKKLI